MLRRRNTQSTTSTHAEERSDVTNLLCLCTVPVVVASCGVVSCQLLSPVSEEPQEVVQRHSALSGLVVVPDTNSQQSAVNDQHHSESRVRAISKSNPPESRPIQTTPYQTKPNQTKPSSSSNTSTNIDSHGGAGRDSVGNYDTSDDRQQSERGTAGVAVGAGLGGHSCTRKIQTINSHLQQPTFFPPAQQEKC